ncbi:unnamed protein product, partial [Rotaria sordida]
IEQYAGFFQTIIFAIINDHNTGQQHNPQGNYKSFKDELDGLCVQPILSLNHSNTIIGPYRVSSDGLTINDVTIFDLQPCPYSAKCNEIDNLKHTQKYSHPTLCKELCMKDVCKQTNDLIHMSSFIHRNPCKDGAQCKDIDNEKHIQEYEHPSYCPNGKNCQDTSQNHEKAYRHLPLCKYFQKCSEYQKHIKSHCDKFRHCNPSCELGNNCIHFHDKQHIETYKHPFSQPCPLTPYHCALYEQYTTTNTTESISYEVEQHCLDFAHVCRLGRNCPDKDPLHLEKSIHVHRPICSFGNKCTKLVQEDHLNLFTHPNIRDIRLLCEHADKCLNRHDPKHLSQFRHIITLEDSGVVRYYNLNKDIDFVQNQNDNIERVTNYVKREKWETLKSGSIPQEIIDWIRTVQPVHRCRADIFESILLHGHVMSRDYMENLKNEPCIIDSILQHSRLRQIEYSKGKKCAQHIKNYVTALVSNEFEKQRSENQISDKTIVKAASSSSAIANVESRKQLITNTKVMLSYILSQDEIKIIETTAIEIAQASIKLHSDPAGIGYERDKDLGTNKTVFSILGPHMGNYGDVFIVFKREILHHPDSNFSIQSATSYASGNCFKWRPWLGNDPGSPKDRINLFHKTKLHASITGYEYATALELIATVSQDLNKRSMNIDLKTILKCWLDRDSHMNIEAHLPQLIPLDYIDHIYMPQEIFDSFENKTCQTIETIFNNRISIKSFQLLDDYRKFVLQDLIDKYGQRNIHSISRPIQGTVITIPATEFTDYFVLPITISQAYKQYKIDHPQASNDITVYIYWQTMNGDMMLTLSNEQINTGEQQPNLHCLISYIAEKPSTKEGYYHENISYLHNDVPFLHEIVIKEQRYAAKSRSFYIGCNTDDFMTFCLEIQRSTGKVILSHSGPNSIYNHEKISSTFLKSDLDLNQLNYIHVSAGAHTVPIRNLFVTFEKQPEPLDGTYNNIQSNLPDLPRDNLIDNNTTVSSREETIKQSDQSPVVQKRRQSIVSISSNVFIQRPLIKWSLVFVFSLIILSTIFHLLQKQFDIIDKFDSNLNTMINYLKIKIEYFSLKIINFQPYSISLSNIFILLIRFNWIIFFIIINELLLYQRYFLNYTRQYQFVKQIFQDWYKNNYLKYGFLIFLILVGPFLLEMFLFYSSTTIKFLLIYIRYFWLISFIILCESFTGYEYSSKYIQKYQQIKQNIQDWCITHRIRREILLLIIIAIPFLLDQVLKIILYPLWTPIIFIIRYNWLILIFILDGILIKQKYFPNFAREYQEIKSNIDNHLSYTLDEKYTTIRRRLNYWYKNDSLKRRIIIFSILILPLVIEITFLYIIPISKLFLFFSWKLLIFIIRYCWLVLIIMINECIFIENNYFPNYIRLYNSIKENIINWHNNKTFRRVIILISILTGPFILEMCFIWFIPIMKLLFFLLWKLCLFLIHYCWLILIIIISEILKENNIFSSYVTKYQSIFTKIDGWIGGSKLKGGIVIISMLTIPALFEHCKIGSISIREWMIFLLIKLFLFIIHYCWLILIIIISEILKENSIFPSYIEKYESILQKMRSWVNDSNLKNGIVIISILTIPALFEHCKIGSISIREWILFLLAKLFLLIIRYCWLVLILIISEILQENNIFPSYIEKYKLIQRKIDHWADDNKFKNGLIALFILAGPFTLEMTFIWFLPIMKLLFFLVWKLFLFLIRYFWFLLLLIISEILEENEIFPNYIAKYKEMKQQIDCWSENNKFKKGLIIFLVLSGPFLLEIFLFYGLKAILIMIIFILKKSFFYLASIFVFYCLFRLIHH